MIANRQRELDRSAFSLLELLIVLTVMVGLMAIVWPSLSRPLANGTLQQVGSEIREMLEVARHEAARTGRPRLLKVHPTSGSMQLLPLESILGREQVAEPAAGQTKQLPTTVIIEEMAWGQPASTVDGRSQSESTTKSHEAIPSRFANGERTVVRRTNPDDPWLIPFLPSGRSPDVTIVLRDTTNNRRLGISLQSATGQVAFFPLAPRRDGNLTH